MNQKTNWRWIDYLIFGLTIFLVFCIIFDSFLELSAIFAWLGRWHPVILHFPIVLLALSIFLGLSKKNVPQLLLTVTTISALITAISGFFLGAEISVKGDLLLRHQWLGSGVALLTVIWFWILRYELEYKSILKIIQIVLIGLILLTGHFGGMLTHGEDFLTLPSSEESDKIPENPLIYEHIVGRIIKEKCVSCHNPNKKKGQLVMTGLSEILKGGEIGNTIVPTKPEESEMIKRLHLPLENDEHMPPDGKNPLSENEIQILERWITLGALDTLRLAHLSGAEPMRALIKEMMEPDPMNKWENLPKVADSTILNLSSDYINITRVASNSEAIKINAFLSPNHSQKSITDLKRIANNIVELDLSGIPIGPPEAEMMAACTNLEWLELDRTSISDEELDKLRGLKNLRLLKIYKTNVTDKSISVFKSLSNLKSLYLWRTGIGSKALNEFLKERPDLDVDVGIEKKVESFVVVADSIPKT
ncbi:c-type cytochrome domain-containing protein [Maribacter sp. HTCC2170]|uniref:c-type cytochrome domain-containing protein n=1 Tax=Maribacter sp. (strain HTCC2170 / KCCM 42371) TaxID=313603 RepID=UPI00006AE5C1|nr:c-type cytochrome domain-containing protein [Maribacter sp. HTCC2170]EAR00587.1 hypothetical protein FB2170_08779 [Maribacter sp. HTCC2170]